MANIIQQLEDLKEWGQDPTRYERRLAFRSTIPYMEVLPEEFDELSDREDEYYRKGPWKTSREDYAGGRLVKTGPKTGKYFYWIGKGDNYRTHYADSPTDGETWVTQNRKKKGWTKKQGSKITMTEKNKGAQSMFKKNYNELSAGEQKKVYDNIYDTFKTKTDKPGKFKVKSQVSEFSATDQAKIKKVYPDAKFTKTNTYGFSPDHPQYDEVWRFVERDFKKPYQRLPNYLQKELENAFPWVEFKWDGKSKYGVPSSDVNLYKKVQTYLDDPKQWRYAFDLRSPDGWMASQIDRAARQLNPQYESLTEKFTVTDKKGNKKIVDKVVGVKDGNKTYFTNEVLREKYGKPRDLLIRNHDDFDNTKKYWNIADKSSKKYLSEYDNLAKLLPEGFDPKKIQLNDLLQFIGDKDGVKGLNRAKRAIELHHEYGVGTRATKNYQLLTQDMNLLAKKTNTLIKEGDLSNIETGAAKALKDETRLVVEDVRYGPKKISATGDIKKIVSQAEGELKKFTKNDFKTFEKQLVKLGCGMYAGGRVGFKVGSGKCITRAAAKLRSGDLTVAEKKIVDAMGDGLKKGGMPKKFWTMKNLVKGEGYFALADFANNLTKGQGLDKSFSNAVETATFGLLDLKGTERDLMKYAKERGLDTKDIKEWMEYAKTYGKYEKGHEDLKWAERKKEAGLEGFTPSHMLNPEAYTTQIDEIEQAKSSIEKAEEQIKEQEKAESIQSGKGYRDLNEMIEGVVAKEWNKTAGTPLDRGYRKMLGMKGDEGLVWGPIGNLFREGAEKLGFDEHKALKSFKPQKVMNYHPAYGYKEDIKEVMREGDSPMEDMLYFMEKYYPRTGLVEEAARDKLGTYDYNPNLYAGGGIAGVRRPNAIPPVSGPMPQGGGLSTMFNRVKPW